MASRYPLTFVAAFSFCFLSASVDARAELRAGAAVIDITPEKLPVLANGGMLSRYVDKIKTRVHARAIVLKDAKTEVALVVVDSCMMGRPLLDEVKAMVTKGSGIASDHILISATHSHTAPSSFGCLGTDADPSYVPFLRDQLVKVIANAQATLQPAKIGFAKEDAADFTALRQWIRRPDRIAEDPFGNMTVRANMHAGRNWDDATGEAGPEDPDLSLLSIQTQDGKPIAVMGNFSMHYFGDKDISADYFGLFSEGLKTRIAPDGNMVGIMSHGCSGDIYRVDYKIPEKDRPKPTIDEYTQGLLDIAMKAYGKIQYQDDADLSMAEQRMTLNYRVPDKQRVEWAQRVVEAMGDRLAKTPTEVYAREQLILHEKQKTEIVVQALRIGDIGIATTPNETYAVTGLKIKAASPLPHNMVIELANGADGYIPPPEQHPFGGYNTWAARSAGLEVQAEPKITQAAIRLLETVSGKNRRTFDLEMGPATKTMLDLKPAAYWRLNDVTGPHAADSSGHQRDAHYENAITYYLEGPQSPAFTPPGQKNRAPHFVGGRLRAQATDLTSKYTHSFWIWNGMPNDGRAMSGWFYSRDDDLGLSTRGEHLGIGGQSGHTGKLIFQSGADFGDAIAGKTEIPRWEWNHVTFVRDEDRVSVYLNGKLEIETTAALATSRQLFWGGRSDNDSNWEGRLDEVALFDHALTKDEFARLPILTGKGH